jgi:hypothetical protein
MAEYRARLVDGPVLIIPLRQMQISFDPRNLQPLGELGTVYPNLKISDVWGILEVSKGALLASDWNKVYVPAPENLTARPVQGDGWTLQLNDPWKIVPGERPGDYVLKNHQRE